MFHIRLKIKQNLTSIFFRRNKSQERLCFENGKNSVGKLQCNYQAKVSKLKRKCLERDQLLAKLVLKLRKKKQHDVSDDASELHDDSSVASSVGLENILAKADSLVRSNVVDSDWSESDHVLPASKKDESGKSNGERLRADVAQKCLT